MSFTLHWRVQPNKTATDRPGTVLSVALYATISRSHICRFRNAVTGGTVDLVVHLDCLHVLVPLGQQVRLWRNWLTIRHRAVHHQTFEGSTSSPPLIGICHRPAWLAGTPYHLASNVRQVLRDLLVRRLVVCLGYEVQNRLLLHSLTAECWPAIWSVLECCSVALQTHPLCNTTLASTLKPHDKCRTRRHVNAMKKHDDGLVSVSPARCTCCSHIALSGTA